VYYQAFKRLMTDPEVQPGMDIICTTLWLSKERDVMDALENELAKVNSLVAAATEHGWLFSGVPKEADVLLQRQELLLRELKISQDKCAKFEARKIAALKAKAEHEKKAK
jgi:hypothetical protein